MTRKLIVLIFSLLVVVLTYGQDRIITVSGDTILCRVLRQGPSVVSFEQVQGESRTTSRIDRSQVSFIETGIYGPEPGDERLAEGRLDLSFSGGPSWLTASTKEAKAQAMQLGLTQAQADSYYRQLKFGWSGAANAHWMVAYGTGAGIQYRFFTTGAEEWATFDPQDGQNLWYGKMKETIYIQYAGPSMKTYAPLGRSRHLMVHSALSAGWMFYRNEVSALNSFSLVTGNNFGYSLEAGLDCFITPRIALGLKLSLFASKMKKVDIDDGVSKSTMELPKDQYENVSALDLLGGIRFIL